MTVRRCLTAAAFAWILIGGFAAAHAQSCDDSNTCEDLQNNVEPNSAAAPDAPSDENSSYLSGGGFDSAGDTGGAGDDGSDLQPHPFEATPNEGQ
ncbi:MAG TPA: hypothetical protein VK451_09120 [Methyloceanibacter sp.]|nr:hypothetical protein [Methyloceanibacter sp.]